MRSIGNKNMADDSVNEQNNYNSLSEQLLNENKMIDNCYLKTMFNL